MFSCDCGKIQVQIFKDNIKICPTCSSIVRKLKSKTIQTKLESYHNLSETKLGKRRYQVLTAIKHLRNPNNREISEYLKLPINSITPRVKELRTMNYVFEGGLKRDKITNKMTMSWLS